MSTPAYTLEYRNNKTGKTATVQVTETMRSGKKLVVMLDVNADVTVPLQELDPIGLWRAALKGIQTMGQFKWLSEPSRLNARPASAESGSSG